MSMNTDDESVSLTSSSAPVSIAVADGIAWVSLNDGARGNALTISGTRQLFEALRQAQTEQARVVVLRAEGRAFCVGGDIRAFGGSTNPSHYIDDLADVLHRVITELMHMDAIVIAAVQGAAAGAGMPLAAAADILVAAQSARFTLGYTKLGLTPDGGSSLLTSTIGLHQSLKLALLNPVLSADEARECGLVAEVVADESLGSRVTQIAQQLANGSRSAQAATKRLLRTRAAADAESALRAEALAVRAAAASADGREGIQAFLAKRPPSFTLEDV
jgi:2-(1,2-epoxy-1,2-dihydrophenyl)acetyl-CoA isomerase